MKSKAADLQQQLLFLRAKEIDVSEDVVSWKLVRRAAIITKNIASNARRFRNIFI